MESMQRNGRGKIKKKWKMNVKRSEGNGRSGKTIKGRQHADLTTWGEVREEGGSKTRQTLKGKVITEFLFTDERLILSTINVSPSFPTRNQLNASLGI